MRPRLLPLAIVLFWAGSVFWLGRVVWAPPGSGMARVDPREVYRAFFEWNNSVDMTLLENGLRRGQINIGGGSGPDDESGAPERVISLYVALESYDEPGAAYATNLSWRGSMTFDGEMNRKEGSATLRIPRNNLNASFEFSKPVGAGGGEKVKARVTLGEQELFAIDTTAGGPFDPGEALGMLGSLGAVPALEMIDPGNFKFVPEARFGSVRLGGQEMRSFLLTLRGDEPGQEVRIYLSEAGEPLRIESDLGFEAVSEILVPLEAYKRTPSSGS